MSEKSLDEYVIRVMIIFLFMFPANIREVISQEPMSQCLFIKTK